MHGFGCGLLLPLIFSLPSQWFRKHRGLATGVVVTGASLGGAVPSLLIQVGFNLVTHDSFELMNTSIGNAHPPWLSQNSLDILVCSRINHADGIRAHKATVSCLKL